MLRHSDREAYVSVDIEAAGPIPAEYSMLSLGACLIGSADITFYAELQPINERFVPEAICVGGLSMEHLAENARAPADAMSDFRDWIVRVAGDRRPVFVGFNASFDWSFVNWYFHKYLGDNPFGIGALDIKAYYMGLSGCDWSQTTSSRLPKQVRPAQAQTHNALDDARSQAEIFEKLLALDHARPAGLE
ncbi:MAG: 3'-5' exonuclease [Chloroflexota bacterium]|nr:3'-5' exonuclease [Chloroflexota bacterium]